MYYEKLGQCEKLRNMPEYSNALSEEYTRLNNVKCVK